MLDIYILLLGCWTDNIAPETRNISDQALASPPFFFSHFYTRWRPYIVSWMPNQLRLAGNVGSTSQALSYSTSTVHTRERESTILYFSSSSPFFFYLYFDNNLRRCYVWASLCILYNLNTISNGGKMYYTHNCWELHYNLECFKKLLFLFFQRKCDEEIRWNQLEKFLIFFFFLSFMF